MPLGTNVQRWAETRDWALWDEEHEGTGREIDADKAAAWHAPPSEAAQAALKDYSGYGYYPINGPLRDPSISMDPTIAETGRQQGDAIHEAMRPMPDDATLYRSLDPRLFGFVAPTNLDPATGKAGSLDGLERIIGSEVTDKGFASTSHDESVARAEPGGILTVIHAPEGTRAVDAQPFAGNSLKEHEVLLDKGTTFRVTSIDPKGSKSESGYINSQPVVHMEVVGQS